MHRYIKSKDTKAPIQIQRLRAPHSGIALRHIISWCTAHLHPKLWKLFASWSERNCTHVL